jgi:hypothetical protein
MRSHDIGLDFALGVLAYSGAGGLVSAMRTVFSLKSFWVPVLGTTLVAAFLGTMLARDGREHGSYRQALAEQEARLDVEARETDRLLARRRALLTSLPAVERVARDELNLVGADERPLAGVSLPPVPLRPAATVPVPQPTGLEEALMWPDLPGVLAATAFLISAVLFGVWNAVALGIARWDARRNAPVEVAASIKDAGDIHAAA